MFMSSGALPLPGFSKTMVYRLIHPQALLLVSADKQRGDLEFIFPGTSNDTLIHVDVSATPEYIHRIIESLEPGKNQQGQKNQ